MKAKVKNKMNLSKYSDGTKGIKVKGDTSGTKINPNTRPSYHGDEYSASSKVIKKGEATNKYDYDIKRSSDGSDYYEPGPQITPLKSKSVIGATASSSASLTGDVKKVAVKKARITTPKTTNSGKTNGGKSYRKVDRSVVGLKGKSKLMN